VPALLHTNNDISLVDSRQTDVAKCRKVTLFHCQLMIVGLRADTGFLAVSPQVTYPEIVCYYFPPDP